MADSVDKYADYVEHPRYGRHPRYTVGNPDSEEADNAPPTVDGRRIPQTEILADPELQVPSMSPRTYYCDIERLCHDCGRPFIFFAEEQQYWYETLKFKLPADCVHCPECRKKRQLRARLRQRYEWLSIRAERTHTETLEMAECCLTLIDQGEFTHKKLERVRELLNSLPADVSPGLQMQKEQLLARVRGLEA